MGELVPKRDSSLEYYRHLLLERDALLKEAFVFECEFNRTFGDMILSIYKESIECIRKKKLITYYQQVINNGGVVDKEKMDAYIAEQMAEYERQLKSMIAYNNSLKESKTVSLYDIQKIKKTYHKIAKLIHPDICPSSRNDEYIMELWERVVIAYKTNNLKDMEELEVLVLAAVKDGGNESSGINLTADIERKIKEVQEEIDNIKTTDPYMYKFLLNDCSAVDEKMAEYEKELNEYKKYGEELNEIIRKLLSSGGLTIWQTI